MVILSLFYSVSQVSVYSGSEPSSFSRWTCRGNLASFLSDKKRGSNLHIIGNPPMSYLKDSSENSRFGPDSRTSGNRLLGLCQLPGYSAHTCVYQIKDSPFQYLL